MAIQRVALSGVYNDSMAEIWHYWTMDDLMDAIIMLDAIQAEREYKEGRQ